VGSRAILEGGALSEPVRAILVTRADEIPRPVLLELDKRAEAIATRAIVDKLPWQIEQAKNLCVLKAALGRRLKSFCRGL
jgi:hypothetical protein